MSTSIEWALVQEETLSESFLVWGELSLSLLLILFCVSFSCLFACRLLTTPCYRLTHPRPGLKLQRVSSLLTAFCLDLLLVN